MQARILNSAEECLWAEFVMNHPLGNIHQAPEWGHFQSKIPDREKYWIVVVEEDPAATSSKILAGTLLVRHRLPGGYCWLYAPRGPLLSYDDHGLANAQMSTLMDKIKKIAKEEKAIFLRVDPLIKSSALQPPFATSSTPTTTSTPYQICARAQILPQKTAIESHLAFDFSSGARHPSPTSTQITSAPSAFQAPTSSSISSPSTSPLHFPHFRQNIPGFQPDHTLILDLTKSENEILAQMKPKGRYNIKLAEKKGVTIREVRASAIATFHQILTETTSRDGFHGHNQEFYENMMKSLSGQALRNSPPAATHPPTACLYFAEYEGKVIAGALNTNYKDTATYYYGASSNNYRNVMAPYLLHWHAIKEAKAAGYKFYDFFGIAPTHEQSECASQEVPRHSIVADPKRPTPQLTPAASLSAEPASTSHPAASLLADRAPTPHPWAGVTEFKKKFGGAEISYRKPQEYVFKKALYLLYRAYKKLK